MSRTYKAYTLWMKGRNVGWRAEFTVQVEHSDSTSPLEIIERWMGAYSLNGYWDRGKTWMIKPKGQEPAEFARAREEREG